MYVNACLSYLHVFRAIGLGCVEGWVVPDAKGLAVDE